jgi:hypothetical protein
MARSGSGSKRFDGNVDEVGKILKKQFDVTIFSGGFYHWHSNETRRYQLTRSTLLRVQATDVMIGQSGSNNQLALFMQENRMLVEVKNYNYCCNEAAKAVTNHNRLAFHTLTVDKVVLEIKSTQALHYNAPLVSKLSGELLAAWTDNVNNFRDASRLDSWPSTCDFLWPHLDLDIIAKTSLMTRSNVSRCYLEQLPAPLGWYQVATHKNNGAAGCFRASAPIGTVVLHCMISGLC